MANAINTHRFKPIIDTQYTTEKVGEISILWGMIKYPKVIQHGHSTKMKICRICGEIEIKPIHGHFKLTNMH